MDIALVSLGTKSMDTILAVIMFVGVGLAAATLCFLYGRHSHRNRKARKNAKSNAKH